MSRSTRHCTATLRSSWLRAGSAVFAARPTVAAARAEAPTDRSPGRLLVGFGYVGRIFASRHAAFATLVRRPGPTALRLVGVLVVIDSFSAWHFGFLSAGFRAQLL